jgi:hypothetical protein
MFWLGITIALVSSVLIGTGTTLQKHALNRIQSKDSYTIQPKELQIKTTTSDTMTRFRDRIWLTGFIFAYLGEGKSLTVITI